MRRLLKLSLAALACVGFVACSSDEPVNNNDQKKGGDTAYLKVSLSAPGDFTRADDPTFADGSETNYIAEDGTNAINESRVENARFFFYDNGGVFVTSCSLSRDEIVGSNPSDDDNVEFKSEPVLVLNGISDRPTYVVTVLNAPDSMTAPATLADFNALMMKAAAGSTYVQDASDSKWSMLMLSSSYENGEAYPFVTRIEDSNYQNTMNSASATDPIDIYVERLQAKVTVDRSITADSDPIQYQMPVEGNKTVTVDCYPLSSELQVNGVDGTHTLYAGLIGWTTTAGTKDSYMLKHIDTSWDSAALGFTWSESFRHRTYWGASYNYGNAGLNYPDKYTTDMAAELNYDSFGGTQASANPSFTYFSDDTANKPSDFVPAEYPLENTNTSSVLSSHYPSAMTGALIKGVLLVKTDDGLQAMNLIRYRGNLYTESAYINYVFNSLTNMSALGYTCDGTALTADMLEIANDSYLNGRVIVQVKSDYEAGTWTTTAGAAATLDKVNTVLEGFNELNKAIGYFDGDMYYYIPIEHLNSAAANTTNTYGQVTEVPEGKYGIVRNHWYQLTIKSISNIGQGVWVPEEPIVPNPGDDLYNLSAQINVLSWRIVKQDIHL